MADRSEPVDTALLSLADHDRGRPGADPVLARTLDALTRAGSTVAPCTPWTTRCRGVWAGLRFAAAALAWLRRARPSTLVVCDASALAPVALAASGLLPGLRIAVVVRDHEIAALTSTRYHLRPDLAALLRRADRIVLAHEPGTAASHSPLARLGGRVEVLPLGLTCVEDLVPSPDAEDFHRTIADQLVLGTLAPLRAGVDHGPLLQAVAELAGRLPPRSVRLEIAGTGPELPQARALVDTLGIHADVGFRGAPSPAEIPRFLHGIHALIDVENAPVGGLARTQAMLCGVPVLEGHEGGPRFPGVEVRALIRALRSLRALAAADLVALGRHERERALAAIGDSAAARLAAALLGRATGGHDHAKAA